MPDNSLELPFDLDGFEAQATLPPARPKSKFRLVRRPRALPQIVVISAGAFLVAGIVTWVMTNYVFVEQVKDESSLELVQTSLETMMVEMPLAKVRHEKNLPGAMGKKQDAVLIVEIDASIIVHGTTNELLGMQKVLRAYHNRIEGAIDETIRSASPAELAEADAQTLRARIRDQINAFYGKPVAEEVLFSHYRAFHAQIKR